MTRVARVRDLTTYSQRLQLEFVIFRQKFLQIDAERVFQKLNALFSLVISYQHLRDNRVCLSKLANVQFEVLDFF